MKNAEYWRSRFEMIEAAKAKAGEQTIADTERMFTDAQRELESQISTWYQRFATNNQISLAEAKRLLKTKELAEFKWDVKEYIKHGEQAALNPAWARQLESASARFHVSRLEALKLQTQQTVEKLFGKQLDAVGGLMKRQYLDGYYHSLFEVQKGFNVGWDIAAVDDRKLKNVLSKPWTQDGRTFSDRIWTDKSRLLSTVHTELTRNMILGKPPDDAIKAIAKAMNVSRSNAGRLVMTESAFTSSVAQKEAFNELDVEQYEFVATLDSHTSTVCRELDGKVFKMSDFEAGVTAPPLHPWCRSVTVPYFEDDIGERAARDPETGKTYYVPSDMKYQEWKAAYVDKTEKPRTVSNVGLTKTSGADTMKTDGEKILSVLPRYEEAVIPIEKFTKYALSPDGDQDKAKAFELALGYNLNNAVELMRQVRDGLARTNAKNKGNHGYGETFEVVMMITGANGKIARVLTAWIDDAETGEMRLVTLHVD